MSLDIQTPDYEDMYDIEEDAKRSGSAVVADPYPVWAELLEKAPVHKGPIGSLTGLADNQGSMYTPGFEYYSVLSFQGVSEVFTRTEDFDSGYYRATGTFPDAILSMDGLSHRHLRDVIQTHFQPATASSWWREKIIAPLIDELVGKLEGQESADLNSQVFARLPLRTVTHGFGLSEAEGLAFRKFVLGSMVFDATMEQRMASMKGANDILEAAIRDRQENPQDDMISRLVAADLKEEDGSTRKLTVPEVAGFCRLIVFAGGGTTWKQLGITTFALLNHPDQMQAAMADRSLLPKAILEGARWYPNDPVFPRQARRDTELEGMKIPKGAALHLCLGAANRDPRRWENPDTFDLFRPVQRSLAFAAGPHSCLGQHVAREEMLGAMNALFDRFPNMRWDERHEPARLSGSLISRGPGPLHVRLR